MNNIQKEDFEENYTNSNGKKKGKREGGKAKNWLMSGGITAAVLVSVILLNIIASVLVERFPSLNIDLTANHTNTLSGEAAKLMEEVSSPTDIIVMLSEESAKLDQQYSQVVALTAKIKEKNPLIQVQYIDLEKNPSYSSEYRNEGLTTGSILIQSGDRHMILSYSDLFGVDQSYEDGSTTLYSLADGALASAVYSVNQESRPVAAFATGHNELLDVSFYKQLLNSNAFAVQDFDLMMEEIPEETQLLILATPSADYTKEEIQKIDKFLNDTSKSNERSLLVTYHPSQQGLPNLAAYLEEWGLAAKPASVVEESDTNAYTTDPQAIFVTATGEVDFGGETGYDKLLAPESTPMECLFETRGDISAHAILESSETSYAYQIVDNVESMTEKGAQPIAVMAQKPLSDPAYHANVFLLGSSYMFIDGIINTSAFSDRAYLLDLSKFAVGMQDTLRIIEAERVTTMATDLAMSEFSANIIGLVIFTILVPLAIGLLGFMVYRDRKRR